MARTKRTFAPTCDTLEKREVLTAGGPTDQAQYMLEVLNLVRSNPVEGAKWVRENADATIQANLAFYGVNLDQVSGQIAGSRKQQPLAWNGQLADAADNQSTDMATKGYQSHEQPEGATRTLEQRLDRAGYRNRAKYAENAFAYARGPRGASAAKAVDNAMQAFLIDWGVADAGHRRNILQPDAGDDSSYSEVGIAVEDVTRQDLLARGFGPKVVTQVFGRPHNQRARILGVIFQDADSNGKFSFQEGRGDVEVDVENVKTGQKQSVQSWDAGGYQVDVDPGTYRVSAKQGRRLLGAQVVQVGTQNVKVDFETSKGTEIVETPAAPPAPVTAPLPSFAIENQVVTELPMVEEPVQVDNEPAPVVTIRTLNAAFRDSESNDSSNNNSNDAPTPPTRSSSLFSSWSTSKINWGRGWKAGQ